MAREYHRTTFKNRNVSLSYTTDTVNISPLNMTGLATALRGKMLSALSVIISSIHASAMFKQSSSNPLSRMEAAVSSYSRSGIMLPKEGGDRFIHDGTPVTAVPNETMYDSVLHQQQAAFENLHAYYAALNDGARTTPGTIGQDFVSRAGSFLSEKYLQVQKGSQMQYWPASGLDLVKASPFLAPTKIGQRSTK